MLFPPPISHGSMLTLWATSELTKETTDLRNKCAAQEDVRDVQNRLGKLAFEKSDVEKDLVRLGSAEEETLRSLDNLRNQRKDAGAKYSSLKRVASIDLPRVKYALSLYTTTSNIVWDHNSENVKGIITSQAGEPTKFFDIDCSAKTSFDITNEIWDLLD